MAQGSINMPGPRKAPIEGIMQALQAVQAAYGINTESQRAKLLEAQTAGEQQKTEVEGNKLSAMKDYLERQRGGQVPTQAPPPVPELPAPKGPNLGVDTGLPGNTISPLRGMMQQATSPRPKGPTEDDLANPFLAPQLKPMLDAQASARGLQDAEKEEGRKEGNFWAKHLQDFEGNTQVKQARFDQSSAKMVLDMINSGNINAQQLAKVRLAITGTGMRRLGEEGLAATESPKLVEALQDMYVLKTQGKMSHEDLGRLKSAAQTILASSGQAISGYADTFSRSLSAATGKEQPWIRDQLLLPKAEEPITEEKPRSKLKAHVDEQTKTAAAPKFTEGQTAVNKKTGERLVFKGGQWVKPQ